MLTVLIFGWDLWRNFAIDRNGKTVQGKVLEAHLNPPRKNRTRSTKVRFQYQVDGKAYEIETDVDHPDFGEVGAELSVEYAGNTPAFARIAGHTVGDTPYAVLLFALLFASVGTPIVFFQVRAKRRERKSFIYGTPVLAEVTFAGVDLSVKINGVYPSVIRWSFQVEGQGYTGSLSARDLRSERLASSGKVVVLYLPENPKVNTLWID